jgi:NADPH-dependent ferric siderophore reductase
MTEPRRRPVPADLFGGRLADCFLLDLEVVRVGDVRPGMRSITFASPDLVGFESRPGQDVMLDVPGTEGTRRRYTIRRADPVGGTLDIEVVLHGTGSFAAWAAGAAPGDRIEGLGPRGVVTLHDDATHHLFVADPSAIPFTLAMLESIPVGAPASAVIVSDEPADRYTDRVSWVTPDQVADHLAAIWLPAGTAAYVNGERRLVRHVVELLVARGVAADSIASKAYWRDDQANQAHGEPAKQ